MHGCGGCDRFVADKVCGTKHSDGRETSQLNRNCSYNAMVLPSETRDNASKQLYWRLKRLGLESTPSNNNYNNYMFIYTIYRLKNAML